MYDNIGSMISYLAVKKERERISDAIEAIDTNTPAQLNALGMKLLILDIVNLKSEAKSKI